MSEEIDFAAQVRGDVAMVQIKMAETNFEEVIRKIGIIHQIICTKISAEPTILPLPDTEQPR